MFGCLVTRASSRRNLARVIEQGTMRRIALVVGLLSVVAVAATAEAAPIPSSSGPGTPVAFLGTPSTAQPFAFGPQAPRHPFMAPNGKSNIHDDAYQSDAYPWSGPLGRTPKVTSTFQAQECASVTLDTKGRLVTVCVGAVRPTLELLDPDTLAELGSYPLPPRKPGTVTSAFTSFGGGGYFYLDNNNRAVVPTNDNHVDVIAESGNGFQLVKQYDLNGVSADSSIISALPDWAGRIWFVFANGQVGFIDPRTGAIKHRALGESIGNSFAVDETGGVYIVTDVALYRFDVANGQPAVTWRVTYNRGTRIKPGQTEFGSGTTPTIVRRGGEHFVTITDNADPRMHVLVYRADKNVIGSRLMCSVPVFAAGRGDTDNSLIAVGNAIVVENNYGYTGPSERPPSGPFRITPTTEPGVTRVDVDYAAGTCGVAWTNNNVRIPSSVSKASAQAGVVYVYEHPSAAEVHYTGARPSRSQAADPWYLTALDIRTGQRIWSRLTGYGLGYNNNYAPITVTPDGTAYVGVLGGLVSVRDTH
jgi:hypothetical protein